MRVSQANHMVGSTHGTQAPGKGCSCGGAAAELIPPTGTATHPVCGMSVDPAKSPHHAEHGGQTYDFCSAGCRTKFIDNPTKYLVSGAAHLHDDHGHSCCDTHSGETSSGHREGSSQARTRSAACRSTRSPPSTGPNTTVALTFSARPVAGPSSWLTLRSTSRPGRPPPLPCERVPSRPIVGPSRRRFDERGRVRPEPERAEDRGDQAEGGHPFRERLGRSVAQLGRNLEHWLGVHQVRRPYAHDRPGNLNRDIGRGRAGVELTGGGEHKRHGRVEVSAGKRSEYGDK